MSRRKTRNLEWLKDQLRLFGRLWREVAPSAAGFWLLDKFVGRILPFEVVIIALFDRIDCLADHASLPPDFRLERVGRETLYAIAEQHPDALDKRFIDEALLKGDIPFVIFRGEEPVEFHWFSTTPTCMFEGAWIVPPADRFYSYKGHVMPEYRGMALHSLGKRVRAQELSRSHQRGVVSFVAASNSSSMLSAAKIPGQRFGFAMLRPRKSGLWVYMSRACRDAHIQLTDYSSPLAKSPSITSQSPIRL